MSLLAKSILVTSESLEDGDSYSIIESNMDTVNALVDRLVEYEEITPEALKSYFVDYYLAQMMNGGFAQFIHNCGCDGSIIEHVQEGLASMKAERHAALFEQCLQIIEEMSEDDLDEFLESDFFGENPGRDALNVHNEAFYALNQSEDLVELNSAWLRQHPQLQAVDADEMDDVLDEIVEQIPNLEEREREAEESVPRYARVIEALCDVAGQELDQVTAGDPSHQYQGQQVVAWHFLTDDGHFYMLDLGNEALMFDAESGKEVARADITHLSADAED